jgi:hypothetical protein
LSLGEKGDARRILATMENREFRACGKKQDSVLTVDLFVSNLLIFAGTGTRFQVVCLAAEIRDFRRDISCQLDESGIHILSTAGGLNDSHCRLRRRRGLGGARRSWAYRCRRTSGPRLIELKVETTLRI